MKIINQSLLAFAVLLILLLILAFNPTGYVFVATSIVGSLVLFSLVFRILKDDEPVSEGVDFD